MSNNLKYPNRKTEIISDAEIDPRMSIMQPGWFGLSSRPGSLLQDLKRLTAGPTSPFQNKTLNALLL